MSYTLLFKFHKQVVYNSINILQVQMLKLTKYLTSIIQAKRTPGKVHKKPSILMPTRQTVDFRIAVSTVKNHLLSFAN